MIKERFSETRPVVECRILRLLKADDNAFILGLSEPILQEINNMFVAFKLLIGDVSEISV